MEFVVEQGAAIVANGSFNPAILHPAWLRAEKIISVDEEASAQLEITHPEISKFSVPGLQFEAQQERFQLQAESEPFVRAADMFYQLFGERLSHTPIRSIGINFFAHVQLTDYEQRQRFGRMLAPTDPWGEFGERIEARTAQGTGGFSTLVMRANWPEYGEDGAVNVAVQPSSRVPNGAGAFIHVNNHFSKDAGEESGFASLAVNNFDDSIRVARQIVEHLISKGRSA